MMDTQSPPAPATKAPGVLEYGTDQSRWRRRLRRGWMVLWRVVAGLLLLLLAFLAWDFGRAALIRRWAKDITIGMSKAEVEHQLGKPDMVFSRGADGFLLRRRYEEWGYGTWCETTDEFPYISPLHLRFWGPDSKDVAVEFDDADRVRSVTIPPG